jgi:hypothetical protein
MILLLFLFSLNEIHCFLYLLRDRQTPVAKDIYNIECDTIHKSLFCYCHRLLTTMLFQNTNTGQHEKIGTVQAPSLAS